MLFSCGSLKLFCSSQRRNLRFGRSLTDVGDQASSDLSVVESSFPGSQVRFSVVLGLPKGEVLSGFVTKQTNFVNESRFFFGKISFPSSTIDY